MESSAFEQEPNFLQNWPNNHDPRAAPLAMSGGSSDELGDQPTPESHCDGVGP
jgi:hypothetical protein